VRRLSSKTAVEGATLNLSMLTLLRKTLRGIIFGNANPRYDIPQSKHTPAPAVFSRAEFSYAHNSPRH
jgi:hypothetical protein